MRPVRNIPLFKVFLAPEAELMPRLRDVLYSGQISEGPPVAQFEAEFAAFVGAPHAERVLSFYSGTAALHTALILAGVTAGDEVITTAMTAEPTNLAILHAGGVPVWADIDPHNGNIAPEAVKAAITPRTRAILAVDYGGIPVSLAALSKVAADAGVPLIEDAAHALGARYDRRVLGTHADFVMFSLQAIKHMTTVDGGMVVCRDASAAARGRLVRWFGIDRQASRTDVDVATVGYKYHMNNVTATIGMVQLPHMPGVIGRHIANGRYFDQALQGIPGLQLCSWDDAAEPSYWFYTVLVDRREDFARRLAERGIATSLAHKRNDRHTVFAASRAPLPALDVFYSKMIHLPCGWWLDDGDREYIAATIREGW
jgi:dTDP-4-amino-4,6-dideoxygalactose transaminase